jgi:hypothetical protein
MAKSTLLGCAAAVCAIAALVSAQEPARNAAAIKESGSLPT